MHLFALCVCLCVCVCLSLSHRSLSLSGFLDSVLKLVQFVGRLTSVGLQLERGHTLLLHHALGFYETVMRTSKKAVSVYYTCCPSLHSLE